MGVIMKDVTETMRRTAVQSTNSQVESDNEETERERLEKLHGQVWDTSEMQADFQAHGFGAPCIVVTRKSDNVKGSLFFQHSPRFYFDFKQE